MNAVETSRGIRGHAPPANVLTLIGLGNAIYIYIYDDDLFILLKTENRLLEKTSTYKVNLRRAIKVSKVN